MEPSNLLLLILMYLCLSGFFAVWGWDVLHSEQGKHLVTPYPKLVCIFFGIFFPVYALIIVYRIFKPRKT